MPSKLKISAKQANNVASKEVQQVKERYLSSFSFIIFDISAPNHGVHLDHKILVWRSIWLLLKNNILLNFVSLFVCLFFSFLPSSIANVRPVIGHCSYANTFNPLTVKNYQHLISLYNIPPESNINVHQSLFFVESKLFKWSSFTGMSFRGKMIY